MTATRIELAAVDPMRLRRALVRAGLGATVAVDEQQQILATRAAPVRLVVVAEVAAGLDARDRAELAELLLEAATAPDDETAWRPLVRARRLLERSRALERGGRS